MNRITALIFAVLFAGAAYAETLSWTTATTREDGQPLPAAEIAHHTLDCGGVVTELDGGSPYVISKPRVLPGYGEHECRMHTVDTGGRVSLPSNSVTVVWDPVAPAAPANLIILED